MSEAAGKYAYSVYTSSLMDWQARYFPTDIFKSLLGRVDKLIAERRFEVAALVKDEIRAVGTPELNDWIEARAGIVVPTATLLADAQAIQKKFVGLSDPKAEYEEADAYVIALARLRDGIVVTQESAASEKRNPKRSHYIPDVCRELGIPCISVLGLMRREGWTF